MTRLPPEDGTNDAAGTLALLLPRLKASLGRATPATASRLTPRPRPQDRLPASRQQQQLWLVQQIAGASPLYNMALGLRLSGPLDVAALERAFAAVVGRHEILRTTFEAVDGKPHQRIAPPERGAVLQVREMADCATEAEAEAEMLRHAREEVVGPFDLATGPLVRGVLLRLGPERHVVVLVVHHIVCDLWSLRLMLDELLAAYAALAAGGTPALPELTLQYADYALWQTEPQQVAELQSQLAYWKERLQDAPAGLDLLADRPRPRVPSFAGASHAFVLAGEIPVALRALCRQHRVSAFMALLAAFQAVLHRYTGQDDMLVGSPVAGRARTEFEGLVGLFANTLVLRTSLAGDPTFAELLARVRETCLDAYARQECPFEAVVEAVKPERRPGQNPLFQVMFVQQNMAQGGSCVPGLDVERLDLETAGARFDLTLSLSESADALTGAFDYDKGLFDAETIARLCAHFETLLAAALAAPDQRLSRLPLLAASERRQLAAWNDTGVTRLHGVRGAHELIEAQARRVPDQPALECEGAVLSYRALDARANALARRLQALGVGPELTVGLALDRTPDAIVGILGILKAGGAYVPLDASHPEERLAFVAGDAQLRAVLTTRAQVGRFEPLGRPLVCVDELAGQESAEAPPYGADAANLAYVIYTSGSTGTPKGVMVSHAGLTNLTLAFAELHAMADQRLLMVPPLMFDASVGDVFPVLASGATLLLHPAPTRLSGRELAEFCAAHRVTGIDAPAALWRQWVEEWAASDQVDPLPGLRLMMVGGEAIAAATVHAFARVSGGHAALFNHYGPTEATVCATIHRSTHDDQGSTAPLPIGRPIDNVRVHVLDAQLEPVPVGISGEIAIGGVGVARGYLGRPDLTAAAFVPDPSGPPGSRLYRTGDFGRRRADGVLEFLGRRDHQIKLRGFRIERGEVEAALGRHPAVRAAAVVLREDVPGQPRLVAYLVADAALTTEALRAFLARRLPDYMLPSACVRLEALPLTPNGKLDLRSLPVPAAEPRDLRAPRTSVEQSLVRVWAETLGLESVGIEEDFFALGGTSLLAVGLVARVHAVLGAEVPVSRVFEAPTVERFAARVEETGRPGATAEVAVALEAEAVLPPDVDARGLALHAERVAAPARVLLTGATGFLGAFLLHELTQQTTARVYCLVRAAGHAEALRRIRNNLESHGLWDEAMAGRIVPVLGDLGGEKLGLGQGDFDALARDVDAIYHNGAAVNFVAPYASLKAANVLGTVEVLRLAARGRLKPVHFVSSLRVWASPRYQGQTVREVDGAPAGDGIPGGYNQTKWVAERLVLDARERGVPANVYRPAQIAGQSETGSCNTEDFLYRLIKGCVQIGCAFASHDSVNMAPVDYISRAIVQLSLRASRPGANYHFFNNQTVPFSEVFERLRSLGYPLRTAPYAEWHAVLTEACARSPDNALAPFLPLDSGDDVREPFFDCSRTEQALAVDGIVCPPARLLVDRYLGYLVRIGFLGSAPAAADQGR